MEQAETGFQPLRSAGIRRGQIKNGVTGNMKRTVLGKLSLSTSLMCVLLFSMAVPQFGNAQDRDDRGYDDPPSRVARLGYMQGAVSFEPAGENEWVQAVANRPMTTGDRLWADRDSRAEVQMGSSMINLAPNTGFSFLNLDDRTAQMEITAGAIDIRVWSLNRDSVYEIDTPNQAFTVMEPGRYRIETSENGDYTAVTVWEAHDFSRNEFTERGSGADRSAR